MSLRNYLTRLCLAFLLLGGSLGLSWNELEAQVTSSSLTLTEKYDDASWHYGGDFPEGLPEEQAYVHSGLFLGWAIEAGLVSDDFLRETEEEVAAFRARKITGPQLFESAWDGKLFVEMLTEEGNAFAREYFDYARGGYLADYEQTLGEDLPSLYHVPDTWESYNKLKPVLEERFAEWKRGRE